MKMSAGAIHQPSIIKRLRSGAKSLRNHHHVLELMVVQNRIKHYIMAVSQITQMIWKTQAELAYLSNLMSVLTRPPCKTYEAFIKKNPRICCREDNFGKTDHDVICYIEGQKWKNTTWWYLEIFCIECQQMVTNEVIWYAIAQNRSAQWRTEDHQLN